jgi:peptidoglycan/xylan/chitin deacetylase (PgdA/CDA1 family)
MYHHINFKHSKLAVRPEIFEEQIKFLLSRGYRFVKLSDAFKTFASSASSSSPYDKTLVLTFDDGYRDFYLNAYPILKKYNVPASFYVINQDIGRPGNVTMEMIKNLHQEGLVEIGAHTVNHLALGRLKPEAAFYQMIKSKELLERELNTTIETIIYPFGSFNANVKKQAQQIGFLGGASVYFGQRPSSQDLFAWRRVMITNSDLGQILLRKIFIAFEVVK